MEISIESWDNKFENFTKLFVVQLLSIAMQAFQIAK